MMGEKGKTVLTEKSSENGTFISKLSIRMQCNVKQSKEK